MMAFDIYLNNSERLTVLSYIKHANKIIVENNDLRMFQIELKGDNVKSVTIYPNRKLDLEDFIDFLYDITD